MNVGAMTAGFLLDAVRGHFKDVATSKLVAKEVALPILGPRMMTAYRMIYLVGGLCARCVAFVLSNFLRRGIDAEAMEEDLLGE